MKVPCNDIVDKTLHEHLNEYHDRGKIRSAIAANGIVTIFTDQGQFPFYDRCHETPEGLIIEGDKPRHGRVK